MLASSAPLVAVIDADLQHDETLLARMLELLGDGQLDIVVGSRYVEHGGIGDWGRSRARLSRLATLLARRVLKAELRDPMSGFFMIRQAAVLASVRAGMSAVGFKILLDLLLSAGRPLRVVEMPYAFRPREHGASKLDAGVLLEFLALLLDKALGGRVPTRFLAFCAVGAVGVLAHMATLALLNAALPDASFSAKQAWATLVAMTANFFLNNRVTYRDVRL